MWRHTQETVEPHHRPPPFYRAGACVHVCLVFVPVSVSESTTLCLSVCVCISLERQSDPDENHSRARALSLTHTLAQRADKIVVLERGTIVEIGISAIGIAHTLSMLLLSYSDY